MHFQLEKLENDKKNIFREKETANKTRLMVLDDKDLTGR